MIFRSSVMDLEDPENIFKCLMGTLVAIGITAKSWPYLKSYTDKRVAISSSSNMNHGNIIDGSTKSRKSVEILNLQKQFLMVFLIFRMGFWMSGREHRWSFRSFYALSSYFVIL
mmetsp:Transcript_65756/g.73354  ORF Transcript_65756/g.73354 Transcript_65756/m.73354 type:complete len:114 (-) Transcript_65756:511-852(-)